MPESNLPNHRIADSFVGSDFASFTIMANATLFDFIKTFTTNEAIIEPGEDLPDDAEQFDDLCDWLIEPCIPHIRRLAPKIEGNITLQQFAFPRLHAFRLLPEDNRLIATQIEARTFASSLATEPVTKLRLPASIQRVQATDVSVVPDPSGVHDHASDVPRRVLTAEQEKFFKPILTLEFFTQELLKLHQITKAGLSKHINVPEFFGVVVSEDGSLASGLLLTWMPFGSRTLWDKEFRQMKDMHFKWETQVRELVKKLHAIDIVWGDVNPGNIVIDPELNAWTVDFGGGFIEEFIDRDLAGTKEGDLDGIKKIFHQWI